MVAPENNKYQIGLIGVWAFDLSRIFIKVVLSANVNLIALYDGLLSFYVIVITMNVCVSWWELMMAPESNKYKTVHPK